MTIFQNSKKKYLFNKLKVINQVLVSMTFAQLLGFGIEKTLRIPF